MMTHISRTWNREWLSIVIIVTVVALLLLTLQLTFNGTLQLQSIHTKLSELSEILSKVSIQNTVEY